MSQKAKESPRFAKMDLHFGFGFAANQGVLGRNVPHFPLAGMLKRSLECGVCLLLLRREPGKIPAWETFLWARFFRKLRHFSRSAPFPVLLSEPGSATWFLPGGTVFRDSFPGENPFRFQLGGRADFSGCVCPSHWLQEPQKIFACREKGMRLLLFMEKDFSRQQRVLGYARAVQFDLFTVLFSRTTAWLTGPKLMGSTQPPFHKAFFFHGTSSELFVSFLPLDSPFCGIPAFFREPFAALAKPGGSKKEQASVEKGF